MAAPHIQACTTLAYPYANLDVELSTIQGPRRPKRPRLGLYGKESERGLVPRFQAVTMAVVGYWVRTHWAMWECGREMGIIPPSS